MNQVERSPSAARSWLPVTMLWPVGSVSVAVTTRPDGPSTRREVGDRPLQAERLRGLRRRRPSAVQLRYGDVVVRVGDRDEVRHRLRRTPRCAAAVRPPELDEKYVVATLPA